MVTAAIAAVAVPWLKYGEMLHLRRFLHVVLPKV
jgi:hypothetical protein